MPVEPEAPPWLHVKAVSPITTFTRSKRTSSSSATIWPMATSTPWPMSILPKNAVTFPSGRMAIQESSSSGSNGGLPSPTPLVWARAMGTVPGIITLTTRAPLAFRKSRREVWVRSMAGPYAIVPAAARLIARRIAMCVPQRHLSPTSALRI